MNILAGFLVVMKKISKIYLSKLYYFVLKWLKGIEHFLPRTNSNKSIRCSKPQPYTGIAQPSFHKLLIRARGPGKG